MEVITQTPLDLILHHYDPIVRKKQVKDFVQQHPEARNELMEGLMSATPEYLAGCAEALGWLHDDNAIPELAALLSHPNPWVQDRAAFALGKMGCTALPVLLAELDTQEESAWNGLVRAFSMTGKCVLPHLIHMLTEGDRYYRDFAFQVFISQRKRIPLAPMLALLSHPQHSRVVKAIELIGYMRDPSVADHLRPFLTHDNELIRHKAKVAIGRLARQREV